MLSHRTCIVCESRLIGMRPSSWLTGCRMSGCPSSIVVRIRVCFTPCFNQLISSLPSNQLISSWTARLQIIVCPRLQTRKFLMVCEPRGQRWTMIKYHICFRGELEGSLESISAAESCSSVMPCVITRSKERNPLAKPAGKGLLNTKAPLTSIRHCGGCPSKTQASAS